jgi:hypothetical protein
VRVGELCLQVEAEVAIKIYFVVANFHHKVCSTAHCHLADYGVEDSVYIIRKVFNQQRPPILNTVDNLVDVALLALLNDRQVVGFLTLHNPSNALQCKTGGHQQMMQEKVAEIVPQRIQSGIALKCFLNFVSKRRLHAANLRNTMVARALVAEVRTAQPMKKVTWQMGKQPQIAEHFESRDVSSEAYFQRCLMCMHA